MRMYPRKGDTLNLFPPDASSHNPARASPLHSNNLKPNEPCERSMDVSINQTHQCAGLGEKKGSPELNTYVSSDIVYLKDILQSRVSSQTCSSLVGLLSLFKLYKLIVFRILQHGAGNRSIRLYWHHVYSIRILGEQWVLVFHRTSDVSWLPLLAQGQWSQRERWGELPHGLLLGLSEFHTIRAASANPGLESRGSGVEFPQWKIIPVNAFRPIESWPCMIRPQSKITHSSWPSPGFKKKQGMEECSVWIVWSPCSAYFLFFFISSHTLLFTQHTTKRLPEDKEAADMLLGTLLVCKGNTLRRHRTASVIGMCLNTCLRHRVTRGCIPIVSAA